MNTAEAVGDAVVLAFVTEWQGTYGYPCPMSAICFDLDLDPSEATEAIDRLEAAGLVARSGGASDVAPVS